MSKRLNINMNTTKRGLMNRDVRNFALFLMYFSRNSIYGINFKIPSLIWGGTFFSLNLEGNQIFLRLANNCRLITAIINPKRAENPGIKDKGVAGGIANNMIIKKLSF